MNKRLLNLVIKTYELKGAAYQVMLALAWNSSSTNECSISILDLASAAHLTKQSVIRALHNLTAPDAAAEGRSILTKVRQGRGTGISATYLINADLMRDLNRLRRHRLATAAQGRGTGVILIPGVDPTNDGKIGNLAVPVEHSLARTLTGEISPNVIIASGISFSPAAKPLSKHEVNKILKAHALAKSIARSLSLAVNPEATADLSEVAVRIAVAHPRNVLRHVGPLEVPTVQLQAIVAAILLEAGKGDITEAEAGDYLLNCVHELQAVVPRYQWHFLPPVPVYFAEFEYRRDPTTFLRARAGASNGKRRGTEGNADAIREFLAGQRDGDGCDSELATDAVQGVRGGDDTGDVPALPGSPERVGPGGDHHQALHESVGGVPVLAKPSYPPRVQWPRRVR